MGNLSLFWNALRAGETLSDPKKWKDRQDVINASVTAIGFLLWLIGKMGFQLEISADGLVAVAGGVAVVLGAVNTYLTNATTKKKGLLPKKEVEGIGD